MKTTAEILEKEGYPVPEYQNNKKSDTFTLILEYPSQALAGQVTGQVELMDRRAKTIEFCIQTRTLKEIMEFLGLKHRETFMENVLHPLLEADLLKRTIPDKPTSSLQKYVTVKEEDE